MAGRLVIVRSWFWQALFLLLIGSWAAAAMAAGPPNGLVDARVSVSVPLAPATNARPWKVDFTTAPVLPGTPPVTTTVTITDLPARKPAETALEATKRKADTIVAAINGELGANTARTLPVRNAQKQIIGYDIIVQNLYTVPANAQGKGFVPAYKNFVDPTREPQDAGKLTPVPSSRQLRGLRVGQLGLAEGALPTLLATGVDPLGQTSQVRFGIEGLHVAQIVPMAGQSFSDVLIALDSDLSANGVQTFLDLDDSTLTLVIPGQLQSAVLWGNTDVGLDYSFAIAGAVPEPASWALLIAGFGLIGVSLRRRRAVAA